MPNILDYIDWRGDLDINASPINDVDLIIFARMSYIPFDGAVPDTFTSPVSIADAAAYVLKAAPAYHMADDEALLRRMADSKRFGSMCLCGYVNRFSPDLEEQFSAVTVLTGDGCTAVYRGTDGTLVGWKEDFNMALMGEVPAQRDALEYLEMMAAALPGPIRVAGHSKGGNLAMYASMMASDSVRARMTAVRNFDGPGFSDEVSVTLGETPAILRTYLPQSSVVGMLLGHPEECQVVKSAQVSVLQHNIYNWFVMRSDFVNVPGTTGTSRFVDTTLKTWLTIMPPDTREKMINGIYQVLSASGATDVDDLTTGRHALSAIRAYRGLDRETRDVIQAAGRLLKDSAVKSLGTPGNALADAVSRSLPGLEDPGSDAPRRLD